MNFMYNHALKVKFKMCSWIILIIIDGATKKIHDYLIRLRRCLGVWLLLLFKVFFTQKKHANNIFLFFKNYFWDQHIKMIWKHKKHINSKKKIQIFWKALLDCNAKRALKYLISQHKPSTQLCLITLFLRIKFYSIKWLFMPIK